MFNASAERAFGCSMRAPWDRPTISYMSHAGYRRLLPVTQLLLFVLLIWFGCPYRVAWESWLNPRGTDDWYPAFIDGTPTVKEQLAEGLNYPATLSTLLLIPVQHRLRTGAARELADHLTTVVFVPILWYLIGRRIDRRRVLSVGKASPSLIEKAFAISGVVVLAVLATAILVATVFSFGALDYIVLRVFMLAWLATGILVLSRRIRDWRPVARAA
jgi:hypothetical protein